MSGVVFNSQQRNREDYPREILTKLSINFLSSCDRPAQEDALAVLMKRAHVPGDDDDEDDDDDLIVVNKNGVPGVLTSEELGHQHLVFLDGIAGTTTWEISTDAEMSHGHSWALDMTGGITIGANEDHTHTVPSDMLARALFMIQKKQGPSPAQETEAMTPEDKTKFDALELRVTKSEEQATASTDRGVLQDILLGMNDGQRAYFAGLDAAAKPAFASKSVAERDGEIAELAKAANDADPVLYKTTDGLEIRKSAGDVVLHLAKKADAAEKENAELRKSSQDSVLRKQAEELAAMPGTVDEKVEMLKGIMAIPEGPARDAAMKALKAGNAALAKGFQTFGSNPTELDPDLYGDSPDTQLKKLAKKYEGDGVTEAQALAKAMATPEGRQLYAESRSVQNRLQ